MNREALVLYLENIKNLEVIRHYLTTATESTLNENKKLENCLNNPIKIPVINIFHLLGTLIAAAMLLAILPLWMNYERVVNSGETYLGFVLFMTSRVLPVILLIFGIMLIIPSALKLKSNLEDISYAKQKRAELIEAIPEMKGKIQQNLDRLEQLTAEYDRATLLLIQSYALNIIPGPHRNLKSMIFISDYMSTSQISLDSLLQTSLIENGVKKVNAQFENFICLNMTNIGMLLGEAQQGIGIIQRLQQTRADASMKAHFSQMINYYRNLNLLV